MSRTSLDAAPHDPAGAQRPVPSLAERCQSGRLGRSRKPLWVQAHRGFESHPLRHALLLLGVGPELWAVSKEEECLRLRSKISFVRGA